MYSVYGGDEFLLSATSTACTSSIAERLKMLLIKKA